MVSAHSKDKSYFRVGFVWEETSAKTSKASSATTGWLLTYREHNGLPRLTAITFHRQSVSTTLLIQGSALHFKTGRLPGNNTVEGVLAALRSRWVEDHARKDAKGFRKLAGPPGYQRQIPLLVIFALIQATGGKSISAKVIQSLDFAEIIPPSAFPPDITWVAPIRSQPQRTYDTWKLDFSPEGEHTPYIVNQILHSRSATEFNAYLRELGAQSGLFSNVRTKEFGRGPTAPFELDVEIDGKPLNIINVGYGVSQALPIFVESFARSHWSWIAIQQPEVHLHPRAQAALGDVFFRMASVEHKLFIVETHSDFLIDRFRLNFRDSSKDKPSSQVLFFERKDRRNVVTALPFDESGNLPAGQPKKYREFFIREQMNLLGI
jgi:hypothetical protein